MILARIVQSEIAFAKWRDYVDEFKFNNEDINLRTNTLLAFSLLLLSQ